MKKLLLLAFIATGSLGHAQEWKQKLVLGKLDATSVGFDNTGIKANDQPWKHLTSTVPYGYHLNLIFPPGKYRFDSTLVLTDAKWHIEGYGALFTFPPAMTGFVYTTYQGMQGTSIEGLTIAATGKVRDFTDTSNNNSARYNGFYSRSVVYLKDVTVQGFSGHGVVLYGEIGNKATGPAGANTSMSELHRVTSQMNGGHGMWIVGPDANQISVLQADVRDNGGVGIYNQCFLGNYFQAPHANNNKMGAYREANPTNISLWVMPYSEQEDTKRSFFNGGSIVIGGLQATPFIGGQSWEYYQRQGLAVSDLGGLNVQNRSLNFGNPNFSNTFWMLTDKQNPVNFYSKDIGISNSLTLHNGRYGPNALSVFSGNSTIAGLPVVQEGVYVPSLRIGNTTIYSGSFKTISTKPDVTFNPGDRIIDIDNGEYRCISGGTNKSGSFQVTTAGGGTMMGLRTVLTGEFVSVDGKPYRYLGGNYVSPDFSGRGAANFAVAKWELVEGKTR